MYMHVRVKYTHEMHIKHGRSELFSTYTGSSRDQDTRYSDKEASEYPFQAFWRHFSVIETMGLAADGRVPGLSRREKNGTITAF